ncbi:MAG: PilC/PilY family type IV pilus protein, partial [Woeseiaceae bacterium]|nr:PilC/PilY family type IV pilus protein [Woeseiaceae bacterium]
MATASSRIRHFVAGSALALFVAGPAFAEVSQSPLYLGGGDVPGNLLLVPSVEWPTINSTAHIGEYDADTTYMGYFDPKKCYGYSYSETESERHFYPISWTVNHLCFGSWSGNFMNWAATQTVDPFRSVLTGGLRVKDTPTETWLEKARHSGQGGASIFPDRRLPASGNDAVLVASATPFAANWMRMQIDGRGNRMRFRLQNNGTGASLTPYNPAEAVVTTRAYEVSIRVKVCVSGFLEANCRAYPSGGFKPEGLIQQYSDDIRFGIFGYLLDSNFLRDGGVLRARQGFVGQTRIVPNVGEESNPNAEWDPETGVLYRNPDPADAAATAAEYSITIQDSGLINYLNKFGQMTTGNHKSFDPNSELYYAAIRYLKNQGNVPEYTALPGNTLVDPATAADGFPIITDWDDPIQYACQKNVLLGIGDVYTHRDKNLPGSSSTADEPTMPALVSGDTTVNVVEQTARVAELEGININTPFTGRQNSAFMAGLAWYANTQDLRPLMPGTQTASTHWVDVLEGESLEPTTVNQYYLVAKYGGFKKPKDFEHDEISSLELDWWHTNGEVLSTFGGRADYEQDFQRPDNYYLAGGANQMVESLTKAFANIAAELRSSATSVATNSTRLGADSAVFQASFDSSKWSGDVQAYRINTDGTLNGTASWSAADKLDARSESAISSRNILTITPPSTVGDGPYISVTGRSFDWSSLTDAQKEQLRANPLGGPLLAETVGQERLSFLRGSRLNEQPSGLFRERNSRLGDIVNSDPQFIHQQDFGYAVLDQSAAFSSSGAGAAYLVFRQSTGYQSRVPLVILSANDGMMHGFNASLGANGGDELFAFVPNAAYEHLYELTLPEYSHRFYVDGSPRAGDVWTGSAWRTIAVGTTGAGGNSIFALDVTNPSAMNSSKVLWEFTHPDMGYTIGQPAIVPLPNGEFGVVVTSGYATGKDDGKIWILDANDGSIIKTITVDDSGDLGPPLVVDLNNDRVADRVYSGDTDGNLWRFDLRGSDTDDWKAPAGLISGSKPVPMFVAKDGDGTRRAITAPLSSAFNTAGQHMVFFGTGAFYRVNDNVVTNDPDVDGFFGIIDSGTPVTGRGQLQEQSILVETTSNGRRVRAVSDNEPGVSKRGWFLDLKWDSAYGGPGPAGERVVSRALVRGDRVIFATLIPSEDPCAFGGDSWLMELNTFTGGRLDYALFDLNRDGQFDDDDWIDVELPDGSTTRVPPSAIAPDINIIKTPAVVTGVGDNDDEV